LHILYIRQGRILGSRQYFPKKDAIVGNNEAEVLESFILQHYINLNTMQAMSLPKEVLLPCIVNNKDTLMQLFKEHTGQTFHLRDNVRGDRARWLNMAMQSATEALKSQINKNFMMESRVKSLTEFLNLTNIPNRMECFDISHTFGESTVASCVVFDQNGLLKSAYRRFNIKVSAKGDDYAAMTEALTRHYSRVKKEAGELPDIVFIDGGKGQLGCAVGVFKELQLTEITLIGVAKGAARKAGLEKLFIAPEAVERHLPADSPALHLIQQIRDEAHRFAISAHRKQRGKKNLHSSLENIPGVGASRRRQLLRTLGGLQEIKGASLEELSKVSGINTTLAERIYKALHEYT